MSVNKNCRDENVNINLKFEVKKLQKNMFTLLVILVEYNTQCLSNYKNIWVNRYQTKYLR